MEILKKLSNYKYPLLILALGAMLMLFPSGTNDNNRDLTGDELMRQILEKTEGVGAVKLIVSENGVVVACTGAENAKVRLDIIKAIGSYTGFGSDKITILKLTEHS